LKGEISVYRDAIREPFSVGFEGNEKYFEDWFNETDGNLFIWSLDDQVSKTGTSSMSTFNTILLFFSRGLSEDLFSPYFDLSQLENKSFSFDYAFNYHKYTPPYFTADVIFTDTLKVFISNDCGVTYDLLFEKSGAELATATNPITNALDINSAIFTPNKDEWKTINIDLSDYSIETKSTLKFSLVSGQGGTTYLDNIRIGDAATTVEAITGKTFTISPNPAKSIIKIDDNNTVSGTKYTLTSINGSIIDSYESNSISNVDISKLNSGVYFITKTNGTTSETQKFIKE
jgi:hypothetical protein